MLTKLSHRRSPQFQLFGSNLLTFAYPKPLLRVLHIGEDPVKPVMNDFSCTEPVLTIYHEQLLKLVEMKDDTARRVLKLKTGILDVANVRCERLKCLIRAFTQLGENIV
ncbi:hypothetical protein D3C81_610960 [compost metagenome]